MEEEPRNLFAEMIYKHFVLPSAEFEIKLAKRYLEKSKKQLEELVLLKPKTNEPKQEEK